MEQAGGFGQQPSFGGQMQQRSTASKMAMVDIDTKKPKVNVYVQDDIFNRCLNPKEYLHLRDHLESQDLDD